MELFKEFESGIRLPTAGGIMIVGELKLSISDEAALKALMECKGASGTLPCMMCSNVVSRNAELSIPIPLSRCMESSRTQTRQFSQSWTTLIPWGAKPLADEIDFSENLSAIWDSTTFQLEFLCVKLGPSDIISEGPTRKPQPCELWKCKPSSTSRRVVFQEFQER